MTLRCDVSKVKGAAHFHGNMEAMVSRGKLQQIPTSETKKHSNCVRITTADSRFCALSVAVCVVVELGDFSDAGFRFRFDAETSSLEGNLLRVLPRMRARHCACAALLLARGHSVHTDARPDGFARSHTELLLRAKHFVEVDAVILERLCDLNTRH